jgi:hypothetical protein
LPEEALGSEIFSRTSFSLRHRKPAISGTGVLRAAVLEVEEVHIAPRLAWRYRPKQADAALAVLASGVPAASLILQNSERGNTTARRNGFSS